MSKILTKIINCTIKGLQSKQQKTEQPRKEKKNSLRKHPENSPAYNGTTNSKYKHQCSICDKE
jgi:hypothetical protein